MTPIHRSTILGLSLLVALASNSGCKERTASLAHGESARAAAISGISDFQPAILFNDGGETVDQPKKELILRSFFLAAARAFADLATQTDAKQNNLALFASGLRLLDRELAVEFQSADVQRALADPNLFGEIVIKLLLLDESETISEDIAKHTLENSQGGVMAPIGRILQLVAPRTDAATFESIVDLTDKSLRTPVAPLYSDAGAKLLEANARTYARVSAQKNMDWMPIQATIELSLRHNMINFVVTTRIKPGAGGQIINRSGAIGIRTLEYAPRLMGDAEQPSVAQFTVLRDYFTNRPDTGGLQAKIRFGYLLSRQDLRAVFQCGRDCRSETRFGSIGRYYPTVRGEFNYEAVSGSIPEALRPSMRVIAQGLSAWNNINIVTRSIGLDLRDPFQPRVVAKNSSFALIVGSDENSLQLSNERSFTVEGLDIYGFIADSQIAPKLTEDVRANLRNANDHSTQSISSQLGAILGHFTLKSKDR